MARRPAIPAGPHDVNHDWLWQALASSSGFEPSQLRAIRAEPVGPGRGLLSTVIRCHLVWSVDAPQQPASVIVKCHSADRKTFRLARILTLYRQEYEFYRRIRPFAVIRAPALLYGDFAPVSHRFVMVLEDLADLETVSQVNGASPVQAKSAVRAVARMHARYWNNLDHTVLSNAPDYSRKYRRLTQLGYALNLPRTLDRFGSLFNPETRSVVETYGARIADHLSDISRGPKTFTHGDFRVDNLFFDGPGIDDVVAIDWQNGGIHSGLRDITYLLSTSVTPETRRAIEQDVVGEYHDALVGAGVGGYSVDECWRSYRQVMLSCLIGAVFTCGSLDLNDEASHRTMEIGLGRTLAAIDDLHAEEFLPGRARTFSLGRVVPALSAGAVRAYRRIGNLRRG
ncbi:MAG: phosphotransferase [Chloroflexota bacterium]|nr:phosphotransferase [Chloroflexota bacterium]MDE2961988.1 phosphotransferase [Chloroflexota bacterium]